MGKEVGTFPEPLSRRERLDRIEMWVATVLAILLPIPIIEIIPMWRAIVVERRTQDDKTHILARITISVALLVLALGLIKGMILSTLH